MHVTKILNFIFLTHYNKIGISWMKSIYVNERQESVLISTKIVTWMKSIYVNERQESVLISTKIVTWMKSIYVNERQGKIKWQFLVTCKNCHLPFSPCRHTLFHSMTYI